MSSLLEFSGDGTPSGRYEIIHCKRALSPSALPDMDYALNPYSGCEHGCVYCYAPEVTHSEWSNWRVVRVKANIVERLSKELPNVDGIIGIGTVTDPYQSVESSFCLTRRCLEKLAREGGRIHMHTKSDLILRDMDLLKQLEGMIAVTVTGIDDRYSKMTEPGAPLPARRLNALRELTEAGLDAYALIGPVLSHIEGKEEGFADAVASTGVRKAYIDRLNTRPLLGERLARMGISGGSAGSVSRLKTCLSDRGIEVHDVFRGRDKRMRSADFIYNESRQSGQ